MKWLDYPVYRLLLAYILGLISAYFIKPNVEISFNLLVIAFAISFGLIFFSRRSRCLKLVFSSSVLIFFIALGYLNLSSKNPIYQENHFSNHIISGEGQLITLTLKDQLHPNAYNDRFYGQLSSLDGEAVVGKALILFKKSDSITYKVGDQLTVYDDISKASDERNPGDFNYKEHLELIDVYGQIYIDQDQILKVNRVNDLSSIINLRHDLMTSLASSGLHKESLGMIQALVLGQRNNIDQKITQSFRDAGVIHILALSGLHVGVILLILQRLTNWLKLFKWGNWIQSVIIVTLLWGFALLTGMSPSILRAVTMFSFIAIGMNVNRKNSIFHSLALSAFFLLLINPKLLFHVGFQLSYIAVIAIVIIQPVIYNFIKRPKWRIVDYFWQILTVTLAAQIGVAPLSLFYFHQFPGLFLLGNMLLLPVLPFIIIASIILLVFLLIGIPSSWLVDFLNISLSRIIKTVESISSLDQFIIKNVYLDKIELVLIYIILLGMALFFYKSIHKSRRERILQKRPSYYLHVALIGFILIISLQSFNNLKVNDPQLILMHQAAGSVVSLSNDDIVRLYVDFHTMDSIRFKSSLDRIKSSTIHRRKSIEVDSLQNKVRFKNIELLIIDESTILPLENKSSIVLLSHSPQVHLDKVITLLQPQVIIADGSSYRNYIERWRTTCENRGVKFLSTYDVGAINLNLLAADIEN